MKKLTDEELRDRILFLVKTRTPIERRWLSRQFADRKRFNEALSRLFFDNRIVKVGRGQRGSPEMIMELAPCNRPSKPTSKVCPTCGQLIGEISCLNKI